jgi:excinuclease ABC subunit C
LEEFIKRFYSKSPFLPKEVLIPHPTPEVELIERWLRGLSGRRVKIRAPRRGKGVELIDLAQKSARSSLEERERAAISEVEGLKEALSLPRSPVRIEAFDLSSIKGVGACGGMVTFVEGRPDKSSYRRFRIKEAFVMSDVDMLREVIKRRYKRILEKKEPLPDLILVDGGQQQTLGCFSVLHSLGLEAIPIIGLAKKEEKVYTPTRRIPITLPEGPPLNLLKRIRDEAHRFAHAYHLRLRKRKDKD